MNDNDVKGVGNQQDYGMRIYDPRIGKFLSVDPIAAKYPELTPYQFASNTPIQAVDLDGAERATPQQIQNAINSINVFANKANTKSAWANISKQDFTKSLTNVVNNSRIIDHASTNLCGIAATCKAMVEYDPESFVSLAVSLYETGKASSNSWWHADLLANKSLLASAPTNGLDYSTYVVMTSMRHSYNLGVSYNPKSDGGFSGLTYPGDVSDIAKNFSNMKDATWDYSHDVTGVSKAISNDAFVIGLFDIDRLTTGKPSSDFLQKSFGNHYIQITGISQSAGNVTLTYWNWGEPTDRTITTTQDNYDKSLKNYTILNSK